MTPLDALAERYRRAGTAGAASPVQRRIAGALAGSDAALHVLAGAPAPARRPSAVLAALHALALAGRAPAMVAALTAPDDGREADGGAVAEAAVETLLGMPGPVVSLAGRRSPLPDQAGRWTALYPAIAEAARRVGVPAVGLVDVGRPAGVNLAVDRVGLRYADGPRLGDPSSPVQRSASVVGDRPVPGRPVPRVAARVVVDRDPVDLTDPDDARWVLACLPPDRPEEIAALAAEVRLAATRPPVLLRGRPADLLADAIARVPPDALPVVLTTWTLSRLPVAERVALLHRLAEAGLERPVAWVSAEGVGVAPGVPTLGDRPASGHSILGLAVLDRSGTRTEVLGRCWSRGRLLSWLAGTPG